MVAITHLSSKLIPLPVNDIDTDQIIPARFLKVTDRAGLGTKLFNDWRYLADGSPNPEFILNAPNMQGREILLAGDNFGCGSSREHAPWALRDWGLRAVVATSFADIFRNNALKNGLLPLEIDASSHRALLEAVRTDPDASVEVDVAAQTLTLPSATTVSFPIDAFAKRCLLEGIDELGYILGFVDDITRHEQEAHA